KRLGRKKVSTELARDVPVVYMIFDVLFSDGELMLEKSLEERRRILEQIFASVPEDGFKVEHAAALEQPQGRLSFEAAIGGSDATQPAITNRGIPRVILSPAVTANSAAHLESIFLESRERGNEGLMIKDVTSPYTPGRRGKSWLKLKRELATLDVVVTAVE